MVEEIDKNDDLYLEMISQPCRTKTQIEKAKKAREEFLEKFYNIFEQDFNKAHRRPRGCWQDTMYPAFF